MNSQPLILLLKEDELSLPKSDDETMQPQSKSHRENQLNLKNASGKEILKYLDKSEYLKISEDVHQRIQLALQGHCCSCKGVRESATVLILLLFVLQGLDEV